MMMNTVISIVSLLGIMLLVFCFSACQGDSTSNPDTNECTVDNSLSDARIACTETVVFSNSVVMSTSGDKRTITSNSIPEHTVGRFPNNQNPNAISPNIETFEVDLTPALAVDLTQLQGDRGPNYEFGVALNGVVLDPVAAEPWGKNTVNQNWDWNLEATTNALGLDCNNAHVQPTGKYHYHGVPIGYIESLNFDGSAMVQMGWAADGFPIYYKYGYADPNNSTSAIVELTSSYSLKSGTRPGDGVSAPCGEYNGKYVADWQYVAAQGTLDECNGRTGITPEFPNGTYYYVLTDNFPGIPRCLKGTPDNSFRLGQ